MADLGQIVSIIGDVAGAVGPLLDRGPEGSPVVVAPTQTLPQIPGVPVPGVPTVGLGFTPGDARPRSTPSLGFTPAVGLQPVADVPVASPSVGTREQQKGQVSETMVPVTIMKKGFVDEHGNVFINPPRKPRMNPGNAKAAQRAARRICASKSFWKQLNKCLPSKDCPAPKATCSRRKRRK